MKTSTIFKFVILFIILLVSLSGCKLNVTPQVSQESMIDKSDRIDSLNGVFELFRGVLLGNEEVSIVFFGEKLGYKIFDTKGGDYIAYIRLKKLEGNTYYAEIKPKDFETAYFYSQEKRKALIDYRNGIPFVPAIIDAENPYFLKIYPVIHDSVISLYHSEDVLEKYQKNIYGCVDQGEIFQADIHAVCFIGLDKNLDKSTYYQDIKHIATANKIPSLSLSSICAIALIEYDLSSLESGYFKVGDISFNLEHMEMVGLPSEIVPTIAGKLCQQHLDIASKEPKEQIKIIADVVAKTYPWQPQEEPWLQETSDTGARGLEEGQERWPEVGDIIIPAKVLKDELGVSDETLEAARKELAKLSDDLLELPKKEKIKVITQTIAKEHIKYNFLLDSVRKQKEITNKLKEGQEIWPETGDVIIPVKILKEQLGITDKTLKRVRKELQKLPNIHDFKNASKELRIEVLTVIIAKEHFKSSGFIIEMLIKTNLAWFFSDECSQVFSDYVNDRETNYETSSKCSLENIANHKYKTISNAASKVFARQVEKNLKRELNRGVAEKIANGHAFQKHVLERGEFAGFIRTRKQFADHIENVINNPSDTKILKNNRFAYWDEKTRTVVIKNPNTLDGGTAFQPIDGKKYFDEFIE